MKTGRPDGLRGFIPPEHATCVRSLNPSQLPGAPFGAKAPVQKLRKQLRTCPGSGRHKLRISPANIREYAGSRVTIGTDL